MKATYKGCVHDGWQHTELFYEYRGYEYIITAHNNGYMGKSLQQQHKEEQEKIDATIERKNNPIPIEEGTFDIDEVFELLGW